MPARPLRPATSSPACRRRSTKLGYDVGTTDGIAGKKTADAIKAFEDATGMSETGKINPRLLAVLGSQPV